MLPRSPGPAGETPLRSARAPRSKEIACEMLSSHRNAAIPIQPIMCVNRSCYRDERDQSGSKKRAEIMGFMTKRHQSENLYESYTVRICRPDFHAVHLSRHSTTSEDEWDIVMRPLGSMQFCGWEARQESQPRILRLRLGMTKVLETLISERALAGGQVIVSGGDDAVFARGVRKNLWGKQ